MKTKPKIDKPARLIARLPNNRQGRAALAVLRKCVNRKTYKLRVLFSGPRSTHWCTHREDAKFFRVYLDQRSDAPGLLRAVIADLRTANRDLQYKLVERTDDLNLAASRLDRLSERLGTTSDRLDAANVVVRERQDQLDSIPRWIRRAVSQYRKFTKWLSAIRPSGASRIRGGDSQS